MLRLVLFGPAAFTGAIIVLIIVVILGEAGPALATIPWHQFVTDPGWNPLSGHFNMLPILLGSVVTALAALVLAGSCGFAAAAFCVFYAPRWLSRVCLRIIELLSAIPSVVYGLWGITFLAPWIGRIEPPGVSLLAAILILSIMVIPTMALLAISSLREIPRGIIFGSYSLGISKWHTVLRVAIPAARSGLLTAVMLSFCRAIGETVAVLMVSGNVVQIPHSLFQSVRTIPANIALEIPYATGLHRSVLFAVGLILLVFVLVAISCAEFVSQRRRP